MYFLIAKKYIDKLTVYDIKEYCLNNKIEITEKEINIIYSYIKKYWTLVWQNENNIYPLFEQLKEKLSENVYNKMLELFKIYYDKYYYKYKNYLN